MSSRRIVSVALLISVAVLAGTANAAGPAFPGSPVAVPGGFYTKVRPIVLMQMLARKDFAFINVHVPYEGEISNALADSAAAQGVGALPGRVGALAASRDGGALWIGTGRGLWRSEDEGRTAAPVGLPAAVAPEVTALVVDPASPRVVYVATAGDGVLRTEDGGQTWADANNGLGGLDVRALAVSPTDGRLHAAVRGKGLFRSRTQARFWHLAEAGPVGTLYGLVSVDLPTGMGGIFLYASTDEGLLRSADCF